MIDYRKELNAEQLAVVEHGHGPCLVLAGAGSGKTRTVTYRVAYLLEQGVKPEEILLVTFTNKAAKEMNERVKKLTGGIALPWSGTFHSIAARILRVEAKRIGFANNFTILDSDDAGDLLKLCLKQEGIDRTMKRFPSAGVIGGMISFARNAGRSIADVIDDRYEAWVPVTETIEAIAAQYAQRKRDVNAMDFDDLLSHLHTLFSKDAGALKKYAAEWKHMLVDEYQDTNWIQGELLHLLGKAHGNILVVGDDAQSIYAFRAATIENILSFEKKYQGTKVFRLETNYRSTPDILSVANAVIEQNKEQYEKTLKSIQPAATRPILRSFSDERDEAGFIAREIMNLRDEGIQPHEIAVLFRAAHHSQALEIELARFGIRYDYRGGLRFFERSHVKDVLGYLRILHNPHDAVAWSRVLNLQMGIGPAGAQKIFDTIRNHGIPEDIETLGELLPARGRIGWNGFANIWKRLSGVPDRDPASLIATLLGSDYVQHLEAEYADARERLRDLQELARMAERQTDLQSFLTEATLSERFANKDEKDYGDRVVLSTVHQAKGLEWDAVFVIHLASGQFPHERAYKEDGGIEEERRLFYVAITRARKLLHLTYPLVGAHETMFAGPSPFLEEIGPGLLQGDTDTVAASPIYVSEDEPFPSRAPLRSGFLKNLDEL